jgi:hypothetical protein
MRYATRNTTSDYRQIDVRRWQREGFLQLGRAFTWSWTRDGRRQASIGVRAESGRVVLTYTHSRYDSESRAMQYAVELERTPCHYGGSRVWFRCPAGTCGRRVAILYCAGLFVCRYCLDLGYDCQRDAPHYRALYRAQAIRMKLGGSGSMGEPFPLKPKGMHWRTYWNYVRKERDADARAVPPWL